MGGIMKKRRRRTRRDIQNLVMHYINEWLPILNLQGYAVTVSFKAIDHKAVTGVQPAASMEADWVYMRLNMMVDDAMFLEHNANNRTIEHYIVHELVHGVMGYMEVPEKEVKAEERVTEEIARALMRVKYPDMQKGWKEYSA